MSMPTINLPYGAAGATLNVSTSGGGGAGANGASMIGTAGSNIYTTSPSWSNSSVSSTFRVEGDADFTGDVKIQGRSMMRMIEKIEERLAILVPDPEKLKHFEALQKAYDQYKMLEALCELPKEETDD